MTREAKTPKPADVANFLFPSTEEDSRELVLEKCWELLQIQETDVLVAYLPVFGRHANRRPESPSAPVLAEQRRKALAGVTPKGTRSEAKIG